MVYEKLHFPKETMPQTVPAFGYIPTDTYAVYADNFDLSFLPADGEVPLSPQSQSSIVPAPHQSPDYIPATIFHDPQPTQIKFEANWNDTSPQSQVNNSPYYDPYYSSNHCRNDMITPTTTVNSVQQEQFLTIFPPSPTPSLELPAIAPIAQTQLIQPFNIKQEYIGLFPPSPPESNGAPSPAGFDIKSEPDTDAESIIDIDYLLQEAFEQEKQTFQANRKQDHQLLREYLQDTTFQRKHNLKPLALESLFGGWSTRGDIEPVISLALQHAKKDVQQTCATLNISPDPQQWTQIQVQAWIQSTIEQFKLQSPTEDMRTLFPEDGTALSQLSDDDFINRVPQIGGTLHAQLEVWKAACSDTGESNVFDDTFTLPGHQWNTPTSVPDDCASVDASDDDEEEMPIAPTPGPSTAITTATSTPPATATTTQTTTIPTTTKTGRQGGSHIHLWQFLKELLATPQIHGTAIRWIDRTKGVFKIEDSVRVARLWGRRKNRPAMNYDKLSRSIRQYYKKGIMKKTERSQRLVYQFCHPYCL